MGMYTEIHVAGTCDSAHRAAPVLRWMFSAERTDQIPALPGHPFFLKPRWSLIGGCASYYLSPVVLRDIHEDHGRLDFHSVSNIKNYDGEIEAFFDWLKSEGVEHYGHSRYECEDESPVKLYRFSHYEADE